MLINEQRLRAFVAVGEELSFTRAATRLGIAQQYLSQQIARFERDLGVRLFDRSTRSVLLTDAGRALLPEVLDLLSRVERAERKTQLASRGESGNIAIGCGSYAVESILPALLSVFHERYPNVTISLHDHHSVDQLDALRRDEIDVALVLLPPDSDDLVVETITEDGFVVAIAATGAKALKAPVALEAFRDRPFIATPRWTSPRLYDVKAKLFDDAAFVPNTVIVATQLSTILGLVAAGVGAFLTPGAIRRFKRDDIEYVTVKTTVRIQCCLVTRRAASPSVVIDNFCAIARGCTRGSSQRTQAHGTPQGSVRVIWFGRRSGDLSPSR